MHVWSSQIAYSMGKIDDTAIDRCVIEVAIIDQISVGEQLRWHTWCILDACSLHTCMVVVRRTAIDRCTLGDYLMGNIGDTPIDRCMLEVAILHT